MTELAREGLVTRVHGGALRAPLRGEPQPIALRRTEDLKIKRVLARATAAMISDGESVIIDNSTTCDLVAQELVGQIPKTFNHFISVFQPRFFPF